MHTLAIISITSVISWSLAYLVYRKLLIASLTKQQLLWQEKFSKLIKEFHHEGPIPPAATLAGIAKIISTEIENIVKELTKLYEARDSNTYSEITSLQMILDLELQLFHKSLMLWITKRREILSRYDKEQGL